MVPGFVPVGILSDHTGNIRSRIIPVNLRTNDKQRIQFCDKCLFAAEQIDQTLTVVWHKESPLPSRTLTEVIIRTIMVRMERIERSPPRSVAHLASHEIRRRIEQIAVRIGPIQVIGIIVPMSQHFGHLSNTPIIVTIFQSLRHRIDFEITRHIPVLFVITDAPEPLQKIAERIALCRRLHRLEKRFCIICFDPLVVGIRNDRHRVVADHTHVFDSGQCPDRQLSTVAVVFQKRIHQIVGHIRTQKGDQRILCTERIPQAEHSGKIAEITLIDL